MSERSKSPRAKSGGFSKGTTGKREGKKIVRTNKKDGDDAPQKRYTKKDDSTPREYKKREWGEKKDSDFSPRKRYGTGDESSYRDRPKRTYNSDKENDSSSKKRFGSRYKDEKPSGYNRREKHSEDSYSKKRYSSHDDNYRKPRFDDEHNTERQSFTVKKAGDVHSKKIGKSGSDYDRKPRFGSDSDNEKKSFSVTKRSELPKEKRSYKDRISFVDDDEAPKKRRSYSNNNDNFDDRKNSKPERKFSKREDFDKQKPSHFSEKQDEGYYKGGKSKDLKFNKSYSEDKPKRRVKRNINAESEILSEIVENRKKTGRLKEKPKVLSLSYEEKTGPIRLNKYISNAGICSRREADTLIESGAIMVNGVYVTELGTKVQPTDEVRYGDRVLCREKPVYLLLNKPKDYLTTLEDDRGRKNVMELIQGACRERIYPVGRLDRNTTGLLLFTNDGEMAKKLMHPKHGIKKVYQVELDKNLKHSDLEKISEGINLDDTFIKPDLVTYINPDTKREVGIEIHSGQNRIVRRIFESLGYKVEKLDRTLYADLTKKDLPRGRWRFLTEKEVTILKRSLQ